MPVKHGEAQNRQNGGHASPEYRAWIAMISRCQRPKNNPIHKWYGARGIKVCKRWRHNFRAFLADMGRKPSADLSLDRINNNKGYSPSNCRWATQSEQLRNRNPYTKRRHEFCVKGLHRTTGIGRGCKECKNAYRRLWRQRRKNMYQGMIIRCEPVTANATPMRQFDFEAWIDGREEEGTCRAFGETAEEAREALGQVLLERINDHLFDLLRTGAISQEIADECFVSIDGLDYLPY